MIYIQSGLEGELIQVVAKKLNISVHLVNYSNDHDPWESMIKAVKNQDLHWAISGISVTIERLKVVDYTVLVRSEPYTALYSRYEDPWKSWKNIVLPFKLSVWMALLVLVLVVTLLYHASYKIIIQDYYITFGNILMVR